MHAYNTIKESKLLETRRVQPLGHSGPFWELVHALPVMLGLTIKHGVLVSRKHLSLGGHFSLPPLDQLDGAVCPRLISKHLHLA